MTLHVLSCEACGRPGVVLVGFDREMAEAAAVQLSTEPLMGRWTWLHDRGSGPLECLDCYWPG